MNLTQWVNAYMAVQSMMGEEWDYQTAHALVTLKRRLYPHVVFYQQEERKLVEEYAARDEKGEIIWSGDGRFVFRDPGQGEEYARRRAQLCAVEVQETLTPLKVPKPRRIKPVQLEALEGFMEFGGEEA